MQIINKVTSIRTAQLTDVEIQTHIDEQNELGYNLIAIDNLVGWYRFFWAKTVE